MHSANSLALLIPAVPALLAVLAAKKLQPKQTEPKPERVENWAWPKRWRPEVAKTGER